MIKHFSELHEALHYCISCPICNKILPDSGRYGNTRVPYKLYELTIHLTYLDYITINMLTGAVSKFFVKNSDCSSYASGGVFKIPHVVHCANCDCYSYLLDINLNQTTFQIQDIILNDEFVTIETDKCVHEIRNMYLLDSTEYFVISNSNQDSNCAVNSSFCFPLISNDLFKPQDVLRRIKKLLIFS